MSWLVYTAPATGRFACKCQPHTPHNADNTTMSCAVFQGVAHHLQEADLLSAGWLISWYQWDLLVIKASVSEDHCISEYGTQKLRQGTCLTCETVRTVLTRSFSGSLFAPNAFALASRSAVSDVKPRSRLVFRHCANSRGLSKVSVFHRSPCCISAKI